MEIFGLVIETKKKNWHKKQRDFLFECPKCGQLVPCNRLPNGKTLLHEMYSMNSVQKMEFEHSSCGGKIVLYSVDEIEDPLSTANWEARLRGIAKA